MSRDVPLLSPSTPPPPNPKNVAEPWVDVLKVFHEKERSPSLQFYEYTEHPSVVSISSAYLPSSDVRVITGLLDVPHLVGCGRLPVQPASGSGGRRWLEDDARLPSATVGRIGLLARHKAKKKSKRTILLHYLGRKMSIPHIWCVGAPKTPLVSMQHGFKH